MIYSPPPFSPCNEGYIATNINTLKEKRIPKNLLFYNMTNTVLGTSHMTYNKTTPTIWGKNYPSHFIHWETEVQRNRQLPQSVTGELRGIYRVFFNTKDSIAPSSTPVTPDLRYINTLESSSPPAFPSLNVFSSSKKELGGEGESQVVIQRKEEWETEKEKQRKRKKKEDIMKYKNKC